MVDIVHGKVTLKDIKTIAGIYFNYSLFRGIFLSIKHFIFREPFGTFVRSVKPLWTEKGNTGPSVLVEFLSNESYHAIVMAALSGCYRKAGRGNTTALIDFPMNYRLKKLCSAYGIEKKISYFSMTTGLLLLVRSVMMATSLFQKITFDSKGDLHVILDGHDYGDLICDEYLETFGRVTLDRKTLLLFFLLIINLHNYLRYKAILDKGNYEALFIHTRCFAKYGILARLAVIRGIKVITSIYANPVLIKEIDSLEDIRVNVRKVSTEDMRYIQEHIQYDEYKAALEKYFSLRFSGKLLNDFDSNYTFACNCLVFRLGGGCFFDPIS